MNINLVPAPWSPTPYSIKALKGMFDHPIEFTVADMSSKWNGSTTTIAELREQGFTHAQIRYGKNNTKVWYGSIQ